MGFGDGESSKLDQNGNPSLLLANEAETETIRAIGDEKGQILIRKKFTQYEVQRATLEADTNEAFEFSDNFYMFEVQNLDETEDIYVSIGEDPATPDGEVSSILILAGGKQIIFVEATIINVISAATPLVQIIAYK